MKILLDECLPVTFRYSFPSHDAHSSEWAGFKGKKNGELLREAKIAGYEVLITVDQGMLQQQNLAGRKLAVVSIESRTNQLEDLLPLVDAILKSWRQYRQRKLRPSAHSDRWRRTHRNSRSVRQRDVRHLALVKQIS